MSRVEDWAFAMTHSAQLVEAASVDVLRVGSTYSRVVVVET